MTKNVILLGSCYNKIDNLFDQVTMYTHNEVVSEFQGMKLPEILIFQLNKTKGLAMLSRGFCD